MNDDIILCQISLYKYSIVTGISNIIISWKKLRHSISFDSTNIEKFIMIRINDIWLIFTLYSCFVSSVRQRQPVSDNIRTGLRFCPIAMTQYYLQMLTHRCHFLSLSKISCNVLDTL